MNKIVQEAGIKSNHLSSTGGEFFTTTLTIKFRYSMRLSYVKNSFYELHNSSVVLN